MRSAHGKKNRKRSERIANDGCWRYRHVGDANTIAHERAATPCTSVKHSSSEKRKRSTGRESVCDHDQVRQPPKLPSVTGQSRNAHCACVQ